MAKPTAESMKELLGKVLKTLVEQRTLDRRAIDVLRIDLMRVQTSIDDLVNSCYEDGWNDAEKKYRDSRAELAELVLQRQIGGEKTKSEVVKEIFGTFGIPFVDVPMAAHPAPQELAVLMQNQRTQDRQDLHDFRVVALAQVIQMQRFSPQDCANNAEEFAQAMLKKAKEADREI